MNSRKKFDPSKIKSYQMIDKGSFGIVYKITTEKSKYAAKCITISKGDHFQADLDEIFKEIDMLEKLQNMIIRPKSILKYHGYYTKEDEQKKEISYFLVTELKEGSLKGLIEKRKKDGIRFKWREIWDIFRMLVNTMTFLQCENITHRDLKPGNILYNIDPGFIFFFFLNFNKIFQDSKEILIYSNLTLIDFGGSK
jgi:serine/threonine protein kinase